MNRRKLLITQDEWFPVIRICDEEESENPGNMLIELPEDLCDEFIKVSERFVELQMEMSKRYHKREKELINKYGNLHKWFALKHRERDN